MTDPVSSDQLYQRAIERLQALFEQARRGSLREPTAATLATADAQGRPSARTVLLKAIDARGCVFYTNLESRKARQLAANPRAALCAFFDPLMEQALLEGRVERVGDVEADAYWSTRDRTSQLGAWASRQSQPLEQPQQLEERVREFDQRFAGQPVPRPLHWSGFRLVPDRIEFWAARPHRLNERTLYMQEHGRWISTRLYP